MDRIDREAPAHETAEFEPVPESSWIIDRLESATRSLRLRAPKRARPDDRDRGA